MSCGTYKYNGGANPKNILADLVAIATGTTNKALLSADCDQAGTTITSTVAAGWSTTTGGVFMPEDKPIGMSGYTNSAPVDNGSYMLLPVWGTNKIPKSTDGGVTWTPFTLPVSLGQYPYASPPQPLAWNGTVWVLCDYSQSVNYVLSSTDGETWVSRSTTTAQQWKSVVWNGSIFILTAVASTQAIATSTDGITWTYRATALPSAQYWGTPTFAAGIWVITVNNEIYNGYSVTTLATSTDGITWTARTLSVAMVTGKAFYLNGMWFILPWFNNSTTTVYTSSDGITWTARTIGASSVWDIQYADGLFVASSYGTSATGYVAVSNDGITWSTTLTSTGVKRAVFNTTLGLWVCGGTSSAFWTSTDAITWVTRTAPVSISVSCYVENLVLGGVFFSFNSSVPYTYMLSYDGINWSDRSMPNYTGFTFTRYSTWIVNNILYILNSSMNNYVRVFSYNGNGTGQVIRALNEDATTYKKILLSIMDSKVLLTSAEDIGVNTMLNKIHQSDSLIYNQQLDFANGGLLFFNITKNYFALLSYLPTGLLWGSSTSNGGSMIAEYARDDEWSSPGGYPTHCWLNSARLATGAYAPRLKSNGSLDVTGSLAVLYLFIANPFAKQAMNASGLTVPPSMNLRVCNFTDLINGVMGGNLIGGIRQTVASYGSNGDEMLVGSTNHIVHAGSTHRVLVPLV